MRKAIQRQEPAPFFSLNASYSIDPSSSLCDLLEDLSCLLGVGTATLVENGPGKLSQTQWSGVYAIQQAHAILNHVNAKLGQMAAAGDL